MMTYSEEPGVSGVAKRVIVVDGHSHHIYDGEGPMQDIFLALIAWMVYRDKYVFVCEYVVVLRGSIIKCVRPIVKSSLDHAWSLTFFSFPPHPRMPEYPSCLSLV